MASAAAMRGGYCPSSMQSFGSHLQQVLCSTPFRESGFAAPQGMSGALPMFPSSQPMENVSVSHGVSRLQFLQDRVSKLMSERGLYDHAIMQFSTRRETITREIQALEQEAECVLNLRTRGSAQVAVPSLTVDQLDSVKEFHRTRAMEKTGGVDRVGVWPEKESERMTTPPRGPMKASFGGPPSRPAPSPPSPKLSSAVELPERKKAKRSRSKSRSSRRDRKKRSSRSPRTRKNRRSKSRGSGIRLSGRASRSRGRTGRHSRSKSESIQRAPRQTTRIDTWYASRQEELYRRCTREQRHRSPVNMSRDRTECGSVQSRGASWKRNVVCIDRTNSQTMVRGYPVSDGRLPPSLVRRASPFGSKKKDIDDGDL